ncbi:tail fiber protein [Escherichia phage vB_EcoP_IMEP8]|uniref:Tail fiber protein n=1 Tax=Escherichia phage vB_EcoP_IMEP8 TaxID=2866663 RepID=A0AAE8Y4G6_9CAUD|nr:tail fiber protein [Escherichia phage vB_EcoP_IMEP8]UCR91932.1 tail fiber protein [Escherichia phage vB_EcoP_IMEP8]
MIVYNNQAPDAVNNVGQFGATEGSIGAYKQAAEYAADAKYWALLAESKFGTIDDLIAEVERLYQQGALLQQDIEALKQDFRDQDARLMQLVAQATSAVADANNAVALIDQKIVEVQKQLDILLGMSVDVTTLPAGNPATGNFDPETGVISLGIPEGVPGKDGSVTDLNSAPTGTPVLGDIGFYVDKTDNTVHKTSLESIANLIPSVRSVSVNGGAPLDGEVSLTIDKNTVGLGNVLNVSSYSTAIVDNKLDNFVKTYLSKAEADADAPNRKIGEEILVWEDTKYEFYTIDASGTLSPSKTENRILTVNSRAPDSSGNIDITIPTGNPSLYLGEMVMFPYDPSKNVSYPGVLPADGRLVSKEAAGDLGPSLISGQLPVVSETQWQAGAKTYFSWGKLADGVTDADSTNFINIRLPDWTGGEAVRAPSSGADADYAGQSLQQIPYIVSVNGISPDEGTGNVQITRATIGAAASGANSDITSLTGLTTALSFSQGGTGGNSKASARSNLEIDRVVQLTAQTRTYASDGKTYFEVGNAATNAWGVYDGNQSTWKPLDIPQGGTGASSAANARTKLGLNRIDQASPTRTVLRSTDTPGEGIYLQMDSTGRWGCFSPELGTWAALGIEQGGTGATSATAAKANLGLGSFSQTSAEATVTSPNNTYHISINNDGLWGCWNKSGSAWKPLGWAQGGTGSSTVEGARTNLGLGTDSIPQFSGLRTETSSYTGISIKTSAITELGATALFEVTPTGGFYLARRPYSGSTGGYNINFPVSGGTLALEGTSDINYKKDIKPYDGQISIDNIKKMNLVSFVFKDDEKERVRRGVIAQQIEEIDPEYVKHTKEVYGEEVFDEDGNKVGYEGERERIVLDSNALMLDILCATKVLIEESEKKDLRISQLEETIKSLTK